MIEGAANLNATSDVENPAKLCDRYYLFGDGTIILRDMNPDGVNPGLVPRVASCCRRPQLIIDQCANCTFDLCEECGYSCVECHEFICHTCVTLFGNRPEEAEHPLCEVCQMFVS
ncbi:GH24415 [Drosophila grimshawi]|uniref:GH24415 n=2 Tax=Drosophila grimshawi TaxID=7222 RepID=B4JM11_DROGR|nr:GH24415 [Drosophila grimshawi]